MNKVEAVVRHNIDDIRRMIDNGSAWLGVAAKYNLEPELSFGIYKEVIIEQSELYSGLKLTPKNIIEENLEEIQTMIDAGHKYSEIHKAFDLTQHALYNYLRSDYSQLNTTGEK